MKWLVFSGPSAREAEALFSATNALIESHLGIPSADGKTLHYSVAVEHPTENKLAMPITTEARGVLTFQQISQLIDEEALRALGFFPSDGIKKPGLWKQFTGWLGY